jgi:hypothetical protein
MHTDWVGTRYMVAMVRLNDQDEPETREEQQRIERLIASAGLLCRNAEFGEFLIATGLINGHDPHNIEAAAISAVRDYCGIASRTEFRDNPEARREFEELREDFRVWKQS